MTNTARPLEGLRIIDLSRAISGPFVGRILSDLGADVVKVELPGSDITQAFGKVARGRSGLYSQLNVGKRSVALNLRDQADAARLIGLVERADVVVENFRPGVLDKLGLGWSRLSEANPRLIMLSITGFGQEGPDAGRQAYAPVIHAESGFIGRQAEISGQPPADVAFALADSLAGLHGSVALLAAVHLRERTGVGQHIDMSMLEAVLATDDYVHYSIDEHPVWSARGETWQAPGGPLLISSDRRHTWRQLSTEFALADPDPRAPQADKLAARAELIGQWIAAHPDRDTLKHDLEKAGLAWAEIRRPADVLSSPTVRERGVVTEVTDEDGSVRKVVRMPYHFSNADSGPARGVPEVGGHSIDEVLEDWSGHVA